MADRFYTSSALGLGSIVLQGPEAHHLATVRRFRPGDLVVLFNGDGREYAAEVLTADRKSVSLQVLRVEASERELNFRLEVASPLPKGDRGDFLIEKLTELGATDFVPLRTERSVVHPHDAKLDRLQRTVIEASKQCGRNVLMQIHALMVWDDYCQRKVPGLSLLAHPDCVAGAESSKPRLAPEPGLRRLSPGHSDEDVRFAVGPEGGFTEGEVESARTAGWKTVSLGPRVLRVETAAVALAAVLAFRL